jgi:hypothetical protein
LLNKSKLAFWSYSLVVLIAPEEYQEVKVPSVNSVAVKSLSVGVLAELTV